MAGKPCWQRLASFFASPFRGIKKAAPTDPKGFLAFANTSEVIRAESILKKCGIHVTVKGPPPELRSGCDLVVVFPLIAQAAVEKALAQASLTPAGIYPTAGGLLEPVSIFHTADLGEWLMVRAANMKVTLDKRTRVIVNISGGGCPDVPMLAQKLVGKKLAEAPEPLALGHTLCCYCLQKAFEELKRLCG